ncbi:MAG: alkaline shock response membrane anchor protein AmaP [Firmicutes bacterium]|nr:alkaline shock response membrane anchor protein AmaP [Bacillota bacterium]
MGFFDRILLFISMITLLLISLGTLLLALGLISLDFLGTSISHLYGRLDAGIVALFFLLSCIRLLFIALGPRGRAARSIVSRNEMGEIKISFAALENLIKKSVREVKEVRETSTKVFPLPGGVKVRLRAVVSPKNNIPAISREIQEVVGARVKEIMGIDLEEVEVFIENIAEEAGSAKIQ